MIENLQEHIPCSLWVHLTVAAIILQFAPMQEVSAWESSSRKLGTFLFSCFFVWTLAIVIGVTCLIVLWDDFIKPIKWESAWKSDLDHCPNRFLEFVDIATELVSILSEVRLAMLCVFSGIIS